MSVAVGNSSRWGLGSRLLCAMCAVFFVTANAVAAGESNPFKDAISKAVLSNPEVLAKWHAFKAALNEREVSSGAALPSIDLEASTGREQRDTPVVPKNSYSPTIGSLVLRQMLFDGFAVKNDVRRLDRISRVRYYELMDASESAALEAARAYADVVRYRKLVQLAEENYASHRVVYDQIKERAQAGVGRKVDLELAAARMALAETNLLVEEPNLHDVTARYQRIVGEAPPANMPDPQTLTDGFPASPADGLKTAYGKSPQIWATVENIMASQADREVRNSAFMPRVDLEARQDTGKNLQGYIGNHNITSANLVMRWNLLRGGSDTARMKQYAEQVNVAMGLRDKACREVRQTLLIAMNDTVKLKEKMTYLDQHQLSIEKAREAFRQQFNIGQRTLLDTLDIENEYFEARRAYSNGAADLNIAHTRVFAAEGTLLSTLQMKPVEATAPEEKEVTGEDALARCPADVPAVMSVDREKAYQDALAEARKRLPPQPVVTEKPVMTDETPINLEGANFEVDSAEILPSAYPKLDAVVKYANEKPQNGLAVDGYADKRTTSSAEYNLKLSDRRAKSVKQYLMDKGIAGDRIIPKGHGYENPIADNSTEEGRTLNRRVEIHAILKDKPEQAQPAKQEQAQPAAE